MEIKFFVGPMSKNIVDAIIEFQETTNFRVGLIPSRRQIEYNGGYCNNWTTKEFAEYANGITIKRDHSGPGQGYTDDDGYESLKQDCMYLDYIHIDPWKKFPKYQEGLKWSAEMINFCHEQNPKIKFEIGTEESIRHFNSSELDSLVKDIKKKVSRKAFDNIEYLVIQSGTSLLSTTNTGAYDSERLISMLEVAKKHDLKSKEHNGDYIPENLIFEKFKLGLDSINIAPEFGLIETQSYLNEIQDPEILDSFWKICFDSKRWEKWVDSDFDPNKEKKQLIKICGHYVLSNKEFIDRVKVNFPSIDSSIKKNVINKLKSLHGL